MLRKLIEGLRILLCSCQKEDDGLIAAYGIDGETESGIIGKRRVYYYHIKIPFSDRPLGGADVGNKLDGRKNGDGKDLRQSLIEFFGRRNDQNTVDLLLQAPTLPSFHRVIYKSFRAVYIQYFIRQVRFDKTVVFRNGLCFGKRFGQLCQP